MAERLENYEFGGRFGRPPKHPWNEWLDGSTWRITRGIDFDARPSSIRQEILQTAARRGLGAETSVEGDSVVFRAKALG
jgi:hypothetical protein